VLGGLLDVPGQQFLRGECRFPAEIEAFDPARQPAWVMPQQAVSAHEQLVRFREGQQSIGWFETELARRDLDGRHLELVFGHDHSTLRGDQLQTTRIEESTATECGAEMQPVRVRQRLERVGRALGGGGRAQRRCAGG
jgi:hypothetical protein